MMALPGGDRIGRSSASWTAAFGEFTRDSIATSMKRPYGTISHGLYWWHITRPDGTTAFSAHGNHGQFISVDPAERLIVVRLGARYGIEPFDWFGVFTTLADNLS